MTSEQLRAARALLRWDQSHLAERSSVSIETIKRLEKLDGELTATRVSTIRAIGAALEAAGVEFIPENGGGAGVRLRRRSIEKVDADPAGPERDVDQLGTDDPDRAKPAGPATDAFEAMDQAVKRDRGRE